jgi:hypothetical protein
VPNDRFRRRVVAGYLTAGGLETLRILGRLRR